MNNVRICFFLMLVLGAFGCGGFLDEMGVAQSQAQSAKVEAAAPSGPAKGEGIAAATEGSRDDVKAKLTLRLHGSNTIGDTLAPKLAKAFLEERGARDVAIDASDKAHEKIRVTGTTEGGLVAIEIWAPGSKQAFDSLARGAADVGMASRAIHPDEIDRLKPLGDMTSPACEHVLAEDGIAIIVNRSNKVTKLSIRDLAAIFAGEITDWAKVGGAPGPITVYARDDKSGTFDAFSSMVLRGKGLRAAKRFEDSEALSDAVANDGGGIGFVGLPYVLRAKAVAVADGDAAALLPTVFTVATEDYPLSRRLHLYTAAKPDNPLARAFVDFALGDRGQAVVGATGFVALSVKSEAPSVPAAAPPAYAKEIGSAERLNISFRFKTGSSSLDNKALQDLQHLVAYLSSPAVRGKHLVLFGFADNQGSESVNTDLSKRRAEAVSQELKTRGVPLEGAVGLGSAMPIASNDTPEGREKNRRVEVWIR